MKRFTALTDYIEYFEDLGNDFSERHEEIIPLEQIGYYRKNDKLFANVEVATNDGEAENAKWFMFASDINDSEYTGQNLLFDAGGRGLYEFRSACRETGKDECRIRYSIASQKFDMFLAALYAFFKNKTIGYHEDFDSWRKYKDFEFKKYEYEFFVKTLKLFEPNHYNIENSNLDEDDIKVFLSTFLDLPLKLQVEFCKTGLVAAMLKKLKSIDDYVDKKDIAFKRLALKEYANEDEKQSLLKIALKDAVGDLNMTADELDETIEFSYQTQKEVEDNKPSHYIIFHIGSQFGFGYHFGTIIYRKTTGEIRVCQRDGRGNDAPETEITLSEEEFQSFLEKLSAINITSLRHHYIPKEEITDGIEWMYVQYGTQMQAFASNAYEVFPDAVHALENLLVKLVHPNESEEESYYRRFEPERYEWFLRLTNKPKYEEYMKSKTKDKQE